MGEMLRPQVVLVGGIGTILFGVFLYYWLWVALARALFLWLFLPGAAVAGVCFLVHQARMQRLRAAVLQAAWHALQPETYHAPR